MRNVLALGAAVVLIGSVSVAMAQERLQQNVGSFGVGIGVGDVSGSAGRVQTFNKDAFLERLSLPETVKGRIFAVDLAQNRLMIETGGAGRSYDEGQEGKAGYGARTVMTLYLTERSNIEQIKSLHVGDEVTIEAMEETTKAQPFGTGKKIALEVTAYRENERYAGFGGLGQRPDPTTERGIDTENYSTHGGIVGAVLPGEVTTGLTTGVAEYTGAAPCWNCEPQPGWGYKTLEVDQTHDTKVNNMSDYGTDAKKPNLVKGAK